MFFDKHSRFVRRYIFTMKARHGLAAVLPMIAEGEDLSVERALEAAVASGEAEEKQPNGDVVSIVKVKRDIHQTLVVLFHSDRPDAPDPTYRRMAEGKRVLRDGEKDDDEEQTYSAHLIIMPDAVIKNQYSAALEEIPGLSASAVTRLIRRILMDYEYEYSDKRGEVKQTHAVLKYEGLKSASLEQALENGVLSIKLSRPTPVDEILDAEGLIEPGRETAVLKIRGEIEAATLMDKLKAWKAKAMGKGWTDFSVDIDVGEKRQRTVKLEREDEAKEILFVRSEQIKLEAKLSAAQDDVVAELVEKCVELMKS